MYSNEFKKTEQNPQPSNAYFMMFSFENVNYLRSTEGLHITDGWRDQHFVYNSRVNAKVQQYDIKMFCFFSRYSQKDVCPEKGDRFNCKVLLTAMRGSSI